MTRVLAFVLTFLVFVPLVALAEAAALHQMWGWLLVPQYGPGPTYASWYGIASAAGLIIRAATINLASEKDKPIKTDWATASGIVSSLVATAVASIFGFLLSVLITGFVALTMGWL